MKLFDTKEPGPNSKDGLPQQRHSGAYYARPKAKMEILG